MGSMTSKEVGPSTRSYLPDLDIPATYPEPITLSHLMAHTPGFEDSAMGHLFVADPTRVQPLLTYLQTHRPARVRPPGVWPAYSNFGTAVAGLIVANVSGLPWEDYVDQHLLLPLGMLNSTFREPWGPQRAEAPMSDPLLEKSSRGHVRRDGRFEPGTFEFVGQIGPAGALSTTATDMARWMLAHLNGGEFDGVRILTEATTRRMHTQHWTVDAAMPGLAHGFIESAIHGYRAFGHGGGTVHFLSDMQLIPDLGLGIFISTNTEGGGGQLIRGFPAALTARLFPPGPGWPAAPPATANVAPAADYVGSYLPTRRAYTTIERLVMSFAATVRAADDHALIVTSPMNTWRLEPLGDDLFITTDGGERVKFLRDRDGKVNRMAPPMPIMVMERARGLANPNVLLAALAACGLVLAGTVIGAWLRRRRPPPQSAIERWAGWLAVLTAGAWLTTYTFGAGGLAPLTADFASVFYEFPSNLLLTALALGMLAAILTVLSVMLLYPVWRERSWPLWRRLRHTGVVLAALVTLLVLRDFNAIGFNFIGS